jgi:three-Cys-motif partner protein
MAEIKTSDFFKKQRKASEIKSEILGPFFEVWCGIVLSGQKADVVNPVLYVDLQAGQGYEQEGAPAIPVKVLQSLYKTTGSRLDLNKSVKTFFRDPDKLVAAQLEAQIENLSFHGELIHKPVLLQEEADTEVLKQLLEEGHPAFTFLDPFESSFSQEMLLQLLKQPGADFLLLFHPESMRAALKNRVVDSLMQELFGDRLEQIKKFNKGTRDAEKREEFLLDSFESIFWDKGYHTFTFRINFPDKKQTSHYLLFASKTDLACTRAKEMLLKYSDYQEDGVPLFGANLKQQQTSLFHEHYAYSIESLMNDLSQKASLYNNVALQRIYEKHNIGTHYSLENYKVAYERLMKSGQVRFYNPKTGQSVSKLTYTSLIRYK